MKIIKLIAVLLISLLMFNIVSAAAAPDVQEGKFSSDAQLLVALGIMEKGADGTFDADKALTRADFAVMLAKLMGYDVNELDKSDSLIYTDVTAAHPAWGSIKALYSAGIMYGFQDATFKPDASVRYEEALKAILSVTGHSKTAEYKGGYPTGYISLAVEKGITRGAKQGFGQDITMGTAATLISNALEIDMLILKSVNSDQNYSQQKGKNILSENFDVYKGTGILTGYGETSLISSEKRVRDDEATIDEEVFSIGKTDPASFLGQKVEYYYRSVESSDTKTFVYIKPKGTSNEVVTVNAKDISGTTDTTEFTYAEGSGTKTKTLQISKSARVIYNGKLLNIVAQSDMKPQIGDVTLIDCDGDAKFETVIVRNFKTYVVDSVVSLDGVINVKYTLQRLVYDVNDSSKKIKFYKDDVETDISSISKWNVISVLESKNIKGAKLISVYISSATVKGEVSEFTNDLENSEIALSDGARYTLSKDFAERVNARLCKYPEMGETYTYHLNVFGEISAIYTDAKSTNNLGYLITAAIKGGVSKTAQFKLLTSKGNIEIFEGKNKIKLNGTEKSPQEVVDAFTLTNSDNKEINSQLINYELSGDNKISEIRIAVDKSATPDYTASEDDFVLNRKYLPGGPGIRVYKNLIVDNSLAVGASTLVFEIPSDKTKEKGFKVGKKFAIDESAAPPIYLYNVGVGGVIGAMVIVSSVSNTYSTPVIVDRVTKTINEDGEECSKIYFAGGSSVSGKPSEIDYDDTLKWGYGDVKIDDLKTGDIVQYILNGTEIDTLRVLVRVENLGSYRIDENTIVKNGNQLAKVISVSEDKKFMIVEYIASSKTVRQTRLMTNNIKRFNMATGKVEQSSSQDIQSGDTIFLNTFWLSSTMAVIYR